MFNKEKLDIAKKNLLQSTMQFFEGLFDGTIDNPILKALPIANFIFGGIKTYNDFKEIKFKNNVINFFKGFIDNTITEESIKIHLDEINKNPENYKKIQQYVLEYIEMNTSNQSLRFGFLYNALFNKKIDKDTFFELTEINQRLLEPDLRLLIEIFNNGKGGYFDYRADRLVALGLLRKDTGIFDSYSPELDKESYSITELGKKFGNLLHDYYKVEKANVDLSELF